MIVDAQPLELWEDKLLLFQPPRLCYFVMQAEQTNISREYILYMVISLLNKCDAYKLKHLGINDHLNVLRMRLSPQYWDGLISA